MKNIKNKLIVSIVAIAVLLSVVAFTQALEPGDVKGSKAAYGNNVPGVFGPAANEGPNGGVALAYAAIKTGEHSDIAILFSAETTLLTQTTIKGKKDAATGDALIDTDIDEARILVYATLDGVPTSEGEITFASRKQTLTGRLDYATYNTVTGLHNEELPEFITLALETTNANAFNFMAEDISNGPHEIIIYAIVEPGKNDPTPLAGIGSRSLILLEQRLN